MRKPDTLLWKQNVYDQEEMSMQAKVEEGCISCGTCVAVCPEVFRFNEEELAEAYADVTEEVEETAKEARDSCPVSVIDLF